MTIDWNDFNPADTPHLDTLLNLQPRTENSKPYDVWNDVICEVVTIYCTNNDLAMIGMSHDTPDVDVEVRLNAERNNLPFTHVSA